MPTPRLPPNLVKICGLREPEHAVAAVEAGADLLGFIFAPTRRRVTAEQARECLVLARERAGRRYIAGVGVFVDASVDEINGIAAEARLDLIQLNGDEPAEVIAQLARPAIRALRPPAGTPPNRVAATIRQYRGSAPPPIGMLLDGYNPASFGGDGTRADWDLAADLALRFPLLLAGGLDPDNVATAIARVRPVGVDVSSGVETDGRKDPAKIAAFVRYAKRALAAIDRGS